MPWPQLESLIRPHYSKVGHGRQLYALSVMVRVRIFQVRQKLSVQGMEETLLDCHAVHQFTGVRLERMPNETTILRFCQLLHSYSCGDFPLCGFSLHLAAQGFRRSTGTLLDAFFIATPASTMNQAGARDPERYFTRKGSNGTAAPKMHRRWMPR